MLDRGLSLLIFIVRYVGSFALGTVSRSRGSEELHHTCQLDSNRITSSG